MTIIWSLILVNVNSSALEKSMKMRYLLIMKSDLRKTTTKKLLGTTTDEYLNFNEHITNVCKCANTKLDVLSRVFSLLSYQQKKLCQTLSLLHSSDVVLLFGYLVLLCLAEKSTNHMRGLYVYVIMIILRAMKNF